MLRPLYRFEIDPLLYHFPQRTHFSKSGNVLYALLSGIIYFLFRRKSTDTKSGNEYVTERIAVEIKTKE